MVGRKRVPLLFAIAALLMQTGCWSSKEIEDLAVYSGLALDVGVLSNKQAELEAKGGTYSKANKITATVQVVPVKKNPKMENLGKSSPYTNVSGTGDSLLEIFRQYSLRLNRPVIGHHLKIIVISTELLKERHIKQVTDFVLRDNDIRPSVKVFLSTGKARHVLTPKLNDDVPSFYINDMVKNQFRTSKIMGPVLLTNLDALMHAKKSFILQTILQVGNDIEFSGAGIVKGDSGHWIGNLSQEDVECIAWLANEGSSGVIKANTDQGDPVTFEMKSMKSRIKVSAKASGKLAFDVQVTTTGRISEYWDLAGNPSSPSYQKEMEKLLTRKLNGMMEHLFHALQQKYKVDVAHFGEKVHIQQPRLWKQVKAHWDETFSEADIALDIDLSITDIGSSTE